MGIRMFSLNCPRELGGDDRGNTQLSSDKYAEAPACGGVVVPVRVYESHPVWPGC